MNTSLFISLFFTLFYHNRSVAAQERTYPNDILLTSNIHQLLLQQEILQNFNRSVFLVSHFMGAVPKLFRIFLNRLY